MGHTTWLCSQDLTRFGHTTPQTTWPHFERRNWIRIRWAGTWDLSLDLQASGKCNVCELSLQDADWCIEVLLWLPLLQQENNSLSLGFFLDILTLFVYSRDRQEMERLAGEWHATPVQEAGIWSTYSAIRLFYAKVFFWSYRWFQNYSNDHYCEKGHVYFTVIPVKFQLFNLDSFEMKIDN